jgi:hypothetical protein
VNQKRIDRPYTDEKLQPKNRHEIWPTDFAFDPSAGNRVIKCLTVANDANHEAVTIRPERALSGLAVTSVFDDLAITRHRPTVIRSDNVLGAMGSRQTDRCIARAGRPVKETSHRPRPSASMGCPADPNGNKIRPEHNDLYRTSNSLSRPSGRSEHYLRGRRSGRRLDGPSKADPSAGSSVFDKPQ